MSETQPSLFDKEHAARYDSSFSKLAAFKDALHILTRVVLGELPDQARVLCVGAGTGAELIYLAEEFPGWHFTAVDLSEPMLDVCRERAKAAGILSRCAFHLGPVSSLDPSERFDAATSLLVSQFLTKVTERRAFFGDIRSRLLPGGLIVTADLSCDLDNRPSKAIDLWRSTLAYSQDKTPEEVEGSIAALGTLVAPLPEDEYERLLESAGFDPPTRFFQAALIHGWFARAVTPVFEMLPGEALGPLRLGMKRDEINAILMEVGLEDQGVVNGTLGVTYDLSERAVAFEVAARVDKIRLALGGEILVSADHAELRPLFENAVGRGELTGNWCDPTPPAGIYASRWESSDTWAFSFRVFAPGWRFDRR